MGLPFTREQFFAVFADYNEAVWPAQVLLYALALSAVVLAARGRSMPAAALLALLWAWTGVVYHWLFFRPINPAATILGGMFVAQASLFLVAAWRRRIRFATGSWRGALGASMIGFALLVYPAWGLLSGHPLRELPVLGVPCPTTIFTLGLLAWTQPGRSRYLLVIPILWAAIGGTAAFTLGVTQDLGLLAAGLLALLLLRPALGDVGGAPAPPSC